MRKIELKTEDDKVDFMAAEKMADDKAENELGDCFRLGWYNGQQKLVSPADLLGSKEEPEHGIVAFAESRGAEIEIDVLGGLYRFYYKKFDDE